MKIEVGMYIRTVHGIGKAQNISAYREPRLKYCIDLNKHFNDYVLLGKDEIIKASHNIIDLIEVGDYVNGSKVIDVIEDSEPRAFLIEQDIAYHTSDSIDIVEVLTKEQYDLYKFNLVDKGNE